MTRKAKKIVTLVMALTLAVSSSLVAFASNSNPNEIKVNVADVDWSQPYSTTETFINDGQPVAVTLKYTPSQTKEAATSGTWTTEAFWVVAGMSYDFTLNPSGDQWKITDGRNQITNAIGGTVQSQALTIGRATSTTSRPAEITGTAGIDVVGGVGTISLKLTTKVLNGEVTVKMN